MGAPESNAGDHYHLLWAATQALKLIAPDTNLQLITLEGLSTVDEDDDSSRVVDLAEYYGGDDFASAIRVIVSQLKHSTKYATKAWTVSRLCQSKTRRDAAGKTVSRRSLAGDLAEMYAGFVKAGHDRETLLDKLQVRLISNQPADPALLDAVATASRYVRHADGPVQRAALLSSLDAPDAKVISMLAGAVGRRLSSEEFCDFLAVLNLSETGTLDRSALARQVSAKAATLTPGHARSSTLELYDLVYRQALPTPVVRGIRRHDVLAALGVASETDLYPAPSALPHITNPLPSPGSQAIAEKVIRHPGEIIVAHGGAGVGKTTALQQLNDHLPAGSTVVIFDCYGGGQYLSTGEERHTARRFAVQTINELAQICGSPLLVEPPPVEDDLWRRLSRTLQQAAETLEDDAVLVITADAADNAVTAASRSDRPSFLGRLVDLPLPARVSVVLTARSHRVESLGADDAPQVEIEPFDQDTSTRHLRRYRPDASGEFSKNFHVRTGGNPRVQFYVLTAAKKEGWDDENLLDACVRTPEPLFEVLLRSGLEVSPPDAGGQEWLSLLVALSRPIHCHTFAQAVGVDVDQVRRFAKGLSPGIAVANDTIEFRDEDFEWYVREQVAPDQLTAAHSTIATLLTSMASTDPDAAAHVAEHLFHAGRHDELVQLVLHEPVPAAIPDGLRRSEAQGRRLDLAASVLARQGSPSDAVRLAIRTVQASVRHDALSSLADTNLELVARHVDLDLLKSQLLRPGYQKSRAPQWMLLAAALSRHENTRADAADALEHAESWLQRLIERSEDGEKDSFRDIGEDHVAAAAEARYRLSGLADALRDARRWRPVSFAHKAAAQLGQRIRDVATGPLEEQLNGLGVAPADQVPLLIYASTPDQPPSKAWVEATAEAILTSGDVDREANWWLPYAQMVACHASRDVVTKLLQQLRRELPTHSAVYVYGREEGTTELRLRALDAAVRGEELTVDGILPPELRPPEGEDETDSRAGDRRAWREAVEPLLPVATLEARAVVGLADANEVAELIEAALTQRLHKARHRWFRFDRTFRTWAAIAVDAAVMTQAPQKVLEEICDAAPRLVGSGAASLWNKLAVRLMRRSAYTGYAADLCRKASLQVLSADLSARERLELIAEAAEIAGRVEPELGRQLFDEAVETASSINDEAARSLDICANLARKIPLDQSLPSLAGKLVAAAEAVAPHVTEDGLVPYRSTLRAAARFDLDIAFAAASRWDDEDRIGLYATVPAAALGGVESQALTVREALALDHLVDGPDARLRFQFAVLEQSPPGMEGRRFLRHGTRRATSWLRKHVAARNQSGLAWQLLEWAEQHDADGPVKAELDAVSGFRPDTAESHTRWSPSEADSDVAELLEGAGTRTWRALAGDVAVLHNAHVWGERLEDFVEAVTANTPTSERVDALTSVADLDVQPDIIVKVLARRLEEWRGWPGIDPWARQQLPKLLQRHLHRLVWEHDTLSVLEQLRRFSNDDEIRAAVLDSFPSARPHMRSHATVNLAALLAHLCPPEEAAQAVMPLLDELLEAGDVISTAVTSGSQNIPVARMLWSVFGHPSRAMRWRAAHATRELLTELPEPSARELATALVSHLDETDPGNYRSADLHFYTMSALAALLVALQRVAHERPDVLAAHIDVLVAAATSTANPHVQIRELARQAALALVGDDTNEAEELRLTNHPTACSTDRSLTRASDQLEQEGRYRFDWTDTLPYWYRPLADVFGVELDTVTEHAEGWIVDTCGLSEQDWMQDARELRDERSYLRMSHRQGAIPVEENLRLYIEYHAMMIAAGKLVDAGAPMRVGSYDDEDPWRYWLSEHLPSSEHGWLADLRSPIPAEAELFQPPPTETWLQPQDDEYEAALGLTGGAVPREVRVAGAIRVHRRHGSKTTYIRSAVVSPETSPSLARALSAAEEPFDWKLPSEDEDEFEVDDGSFVLRGWLTEPYGGHEGLEHHDPYAQDISPWRPLPGERFCTAIGTHADRTTLTVQKPDGTVVARVEQWADPDDGTEADFTSSGHRLHVTRDALLNHLQNFRMDLIVEVQIGGYRREPESTYDRRSKLYVVDADGNVSRW